MKIRQPGYIIARQSDCGDTYFSWSTYSPASDTEMLVREQSIEFEVPDNYDYTSEKVKMLCLRREKIQRNFDNAMEDINKQIDAAMGVVREDEL